MLDRLAACAVASGIFDEVILAADDADDAGSLRRLDRFRVTVKFLRLLHAGNFEHEKIYFARSSVKSSFISLPWSRNTQASVW
jgi:hypothetical protein